MGKEDDVAKYSHTITVEGSGRFPADMLRYCRCYPATEDDSMKLARSIAQDNGAREPITLKKINGDKEPQWTKGRWQSFQWRIVNQETRKLT